jgi:hypothetical protein
LKKTIKVIFAKRIGQEEAGEDMPVQMEGLEDMRSIHTPLNSTQCRPKPTFDHMEMISAYTGLFIMLIVAIYSR